MQKDPRSSVLSSPFPLPLTGLWARLPGTAGIFLLTQQEIRVEYQSKVSDAWSAGPLPGSASCNPPDKAGSECLHP